MKKLTKIILGGALIATSFLSCLKEQIPLPDKSFWDEIKKLKK